MALPHKNLRVQVLVRGMWGKLIHKARPERTFIRDRALADELNIDSPGLGLHGYRYQIPGYVANLRKWQNLDIELLIYADGDPRQIGAIDNLQVIAEPRLPQPPQPTPTILSVYKAPLSR